MACCAFAVFLAAQLLAPFVWLRQRLFGPAAPRPNRAVSWSFTDAVPVGSPPVSRRFGRLGRMTLAAVGIELLLALAIDAHLSADLPRDSRYDNAWYAAQAQLGPRCSALAAML
jgi:hypothetical protein